MIDCLILGDSIAVGVSQIRKECVAYAQSGLNSRIWNGVYIDDIKPAKTTIISLGSNDVEKLHTETELVALRTRVQSGRVFWILPAIKPKKQQIVRDVARAFGDTILEIPELSPDGVHPTYNGYKKLGEMSK